MLTELAALRQFFDRLDESWEFAIDSRNDDRGFCPVSQLENLRFLYRRFQRGETLVHQVDAPAKLFFRGAAPAGPPDSETCCLSKSFLRRLALRRWRGK
jgi:hypothetical protein